MTASRCATTPRWCACCRTAAATSPAWACRGRTASPRSPRRRGCGAAAASRRIPNGGRATSDGPGTTPRCAARATTRATASAWRWRWGPCPTASGQAAASPPRPHAAPPPPPARPAPHPPRPAPAPPPHGDRKLTDKTNRLSYPYGVLVNARGLRLFDEGEDFQFYTYAKLGGIIVNEPGGIGWQIFDAKVTHLLEGRYKTGTPLSADSLDTLA